MLTQNKVVTSKTMKPVVGNFSRRTFLRDIEFMMWSLNLPIKFDPVRKTYLYTRPVKQLPTLTISPDEMQALTTGQAVLAQFVGDPIALKLRSALAKIANLIGVNALNSSSSSTVKVVGAVQPHLKHFSDLEKAIMDRQPVQFVYRKTGKDELTKKARVVHPHHCVFNKGRWYLTAYEPASRIMKNYAFTRIEDLKTLDGHFKRQAGFDPDTHFSSGFGIIQGQGDYQIEVEFDRWGADLLEGTVWHSTQKITPMGDGRVRLTMHLTSLDELTNWLMSWGEHATVIAPTELRDRIHTIGKAIVQKYAPGNACPLPASTG